MPPGGGLNAVLKMLVDLVRNMLLLLSLVVVRNLPSFLRLLYGQRSELLFDHYVFLSFWLCLL